MQKPTIGIYVPLWLCRSDKSDQVFADELVRTIAQSERYQPLSLDLPKLHLSSEKDALDFVEKNNLAAVVQHDSEFFKRNLRYAANVKWLETHVPFINSLECQELGHNKIESNKLLREKGIPMLDVAIIDSVQSLENHIQEEELYVVKPHNRGAGKGVRLIKKHSGKFLGYYDGSWRDIEILEKATDTVIKELRIKFNFNPRYPLLFLKKGLMDFTYHPMLVEPYFNNHDEGFSSLRCTVIGSEVVEAVKRTNHKNITSNISSGGKATKIELTGSQKEAAVAATHVIGAHYAGVDFLVCGDKWVIGEVNIGPFTVFSKYTGVNVGRIFGEYLMKECDAFGSSRNSNYCIMGSGIFSGSTYLARISASISSLSLPYVR